MDQSKKKNLIVKIKAVGRCLKEYSLYRQEVDAFNLT